MRLSLATALIALVVCAAPRAATPITVVLTSETPTSLPGLAAPYARAVLTITQPRARKDGYLVSIVRVRQLDLPEHRNYFFRADFGRYHKYLCEGRKCAGDVPWVYSREKLKALSTFGARIEVFIAAKSGHIWSVAGGRSGPRRSQRPSGRTRSNASRAS
jgi:hypothetical protein